MSAAHSTLTAERLRELLHYDSETGIFTRLQGAGGSKPGFQYLKPNKLGYIVIRIDRQLYYAHRLAWLYMTGRWPEFEIDHKDLNRANNALANLRDATHSVNNQNKRNGEVTSTSPLLGVSFCAITKRWKAQIAANGKNKNLGRFVTEEEAHAAYLKAKRELHEGCTI